MKPSTPYWINMIWEFKKQNIIMRNTFFILVILFGVSFLVKAQSPEQMEKIEAARIALITERLELSPEQAERFWPIYREFTDQRRGILQDLRDLRQQSASEGINEDERKSLLEKAHNLRQKELNLERDYSERLMRIISAQQLASLRKAETDFTRILLERLEQRKDQQQRKDEIRNRREEILKDRRGN